MAFLEWEETRTNLTHQYLAQIAEQVAKGRVQKKADLKKIKREDFILKVVPNSTQNRMAQSKHAWKMFAALNKGKVKKSPAKPTTVRTKKKKI